MPGTMPQMRQYGANGTPLTDFDFLRPTTETQTRTHTIGTVMTVTRARLFQYSLGSEND
jgi:hypothetical protein